MTGPVIPTHARSLHPGFRSPFEYRWIASANGRLGEPSLHGPLLL